MRLTLANGLLVSAYLTAQQRQKHRQREASWHMGTLAHAITMAPLHRGTRGCSVCLYMSTCLYIYMSTYMSVYPFICPSVWTHVIPIFSLQASTCPLLPQLPYRLVYASPSGLFVMALHFVLYENKNCSLSV